jgi:hypothetical protein
MMIINGDSRAVNKLEASLTDDTRVIIYDHHMFIVQATGYYVLLLPHNASMCIVDQGKMQLRVKQSSLFRLEIGDG